MGPAEPAAALSMGPWQRPSAPGRHSDWDISVLLGYTQTERASERSEKGKERACERGSERETNMEGGAGGGREARDKERHVYRRSEYSDSDIQRPIKCKILHCLIIFDGV